MVFILIVQIGNSPTGTCPGCESYVITIEKEMGKSTINLKVFVNKTTVEVGYSVDPNQAIDKEKVLTNDVRSSKSTYSGTPVNIGNYKKEDDTYKNEDEVKTSDESVDEGYIKVGWRSEDQWNLEELSSCQNNDFSKFDPKSKTKYALCKIPKYLINQEDKDEDGCISTVVEYYDNYSVKRASVDELVCSGVSSMEGGWIRDALDKISRNLTVIPLCLPTIALLGVFISTMFASGRNPLSLFDLTTPKMPSGKSLLVSGYIAGQIITVQTRKNMDIMQRNLDIALRKAAGREGLPGSIRKVFKRGIPGPIYALLTSISSKSMSKKPKSRLDLYLKAIRNTLESIRNRIADPHTRGAIDNLLRDLRDINRDMGEEGINKLINLLSTRRIRSLGLMKKEADLLETVIETIKTREAISRVVKITDAKPTGVVFKRPLSYVLFKAVTKPIEILMLPFPVARQITKAMANNMYGGYRTAVGFVKMAVAAPLSIIARKYYSNKPDQLRRIRQSAKEAREEIKKSRMPITISKNPLARAVDKVISFTESPEMGEFEKIDRTLAFDYTNFVRAELWHMFSMQVVSKIMDELDDDQKNKLREILRNTAAKLADGRITGWADDIYLSEMWDEIEIFIEGLDQTKKEAIRKIENDAIQRIRAFVTRQAIDRRDDVPEEISELEGLFEMVGEYVRGTGMEGRFETLRNIHGNPNSYEDLALNAVKISTEYREPLLKLLRPEQDLETNLMEFVFMHMYEQNLRYFAERNRMVEGEEDTLMGDTLLQSLAFIISQSIGLRKGPKESLMWKVERFMKKVLKGTADIDIDPYAFLGPEGLTKLPKTTTGETVEPLLYMDYAWITNDPEDPKRSWSVRGGTFKQFAQSLSGNPKNPEADGITSMFMSAFYPGAEMITREGDETKEYQETRLKAYELHNLMKRIGDFSHGIYPNAGTYWEKLMKFDPNNTPREQEFEIGSHMKALAEYVRRYPLLAVKFGDRKGDRDMEKLFRGLSEMSDIEVLRIVYRIANAGEVRINVNGEEINLDRNFIREMFAFYSKTKLTRDMAKFGGFVKSDSGRFMPANLSMTGNFNYTAVSGSVVLKDSESGRWVAYDPYEHSHREHTGIEKIRNSGNEELANKLEMAIRRGVPPNQSSKEFYKGLFIELNRAAQNGIIDGVEYFTIANRINKVSGISGMIYLPEKMAIASKSSDVSRWKLGRLSSEDVLLRRRTEEESMFTSGLVGSVPNMITNWLSQRTSGDEKLVGLTWDTAYRITKLKKMYDTTDERNRRMLSARGMIFTRGFDAIRHYSEVYSASVDNWFDRAPIAPSARTGLIVSGVAGGAPIGPSTLRDVGQLSFFGMRSNAGTPINPESGMIGRVVSKIERGLNVISRIPYNIYTFPSYLATWFLNPLSTRMRFGFYNLRMLNTGTPYDIDINPIHPAKEFPSSKKLARKSITQVRSMSERGLVWGGIYGLTKTIATAMDSQLSGIILGGMALASGVGIVGSVGIGIAGRALGGLVGGKLIKRGLEKMDQKITSRMKRQGKFARAGLIGPVQRERIFTPESVVGMYETTLMRTQNAYSGYWTQNPYLVEVGYVGGGTRHRWFAGRIADSGGIVDEGVRTSLYRESSPGSASLGLVYESRDEEVRDMSRTITTYKEGSRLSKGLAIARMGAKGAFILGKRLLFPYQAFAKGISETYRGATSGTGAMRGAIRGILGTEMKLMEVPKRSRPRPAGIPRMRDIARGVVDRVKNSGSVRLLRGEKYGVCPICGSEIVGGRGCRRCNRPTM